MVVGESLAQLGGGLLLSAGFLVGLLHAFEPDHVAAMLTQVRGGGKKDPAGPFGGTWAAALRNSLLGAFWGFGHMSTILLVSALVFVFALGIPAMAFDGLEIAVGAVLVALGISMCGRRKAFRVRHEHPHAHEGGIVHTHPHEHGRGHSHTHKSYLIGCLNGLAGSGSLIAVGVVALSDISEVLAFVLVFGLGSVIGMMAVAGALSSTFLISGRFAGMGKWVRVLAGAVTGAIGLDVIAGIVVPGFPGFL